jgi:hypothetical protein
VQKIRGMSSHKSPMQANGRNQIPDRISNIEQGMEYRITKSAAGGLPFDIRYSTFDILLFAFQLLRV